MSDEQADTTEAVATIGRSPGTVYVLPHTTESIAEFLNPALARVDPESPAVQAVIVTADTETALAIADTAHSLNGATGIEVLPVTSAARSARLLKARPIHAVAGSPEELLSLVAGSHLKLNDLRVIVFAWAEDVLDQGEKAVSAVESLISDSGKSAERVIVTRKLEKKIEDFVERYARRARRAPMPLDDIGSGEIPELKYLLSAGIAKPASLRRLLDELDPPSAAIVVRTAVGEEEARQILHTLGYSGPESPVNIVRGTPAGPVHTVILYEAPVRRGEISSLSSAGAVNLITLVRPSELSPLRELMGAKVSPMNLGGVSNKLRRRDDTIRSELRSVLSSGIPPREIAPLEPLLAEYDAVEIAAAALQLLERERRLAKSAPAVAPAAPVSTAAAGWTGEMSKLFVTLGERDGIKAGDLVGTIAGEAGIPGSKVGKVDVYESHTIVEVPASESERIISVLNGKMIKGRKVAVRADRPKSERKSSDDRARPERPRSGAPRFDRPRSDSRGDRRPFDRDRPPRGGSDRPRSGSDRPRSGAPPRRGRPER